MWRELIKIVGKALTEYLILRQERKIKKLMRKRVKIKTKQLKVTKRHDELVEKSQKPASGVVIKPDGIDSRRDV